LTSVILDKTEGLSSSNPDPLNLIERDLIIAAVIEARRSGGFMVRHLLRHFKHAAIEQVFRDPRRPETGSAWFAEVSRNRICSNSF